MSDAFCVGIEVEGRGTVYDDQCLPRGMVSLERFFPPSGGSPSSSSFSSSCLYVCVCPFHASLPAPSFSYADNGWAEKATGKTAMVDLYSNYLMASM
jgi:hypothetical protein